MNTFLPYSDFQKSARVLDNKRLGKQRVEVLQLLRGQFPNHPCSKMWRGYDDALMAYGVAICEEWIGRGFRDTVSSNFYLADSIILPPWIGWEEFHASHRSNLLRKDPAWYGRFGWAEGPNLPYIWGHT